MSDAIMPDGRQITLLLKGPAGLRQAIREDDSEFWVRIIGPSLPPVLLPAPSASPVPANPGPATQMYRGLEPYIPVTHMSRISDEIKKYIPSLKTTNYEDPQFGDMVYAYDRATDFTARVTAESYTFTLDIDKIFVPNKLICTSGKQLYLNAMDPATQRTHRVDFSFEQDPHTEKFPTELLIYERSGLGTEFKKQRFLADVRSLIHTLFHHAPETSRLAISKGLLLPKDEPPTKKAKHDPQP